MIRQTVIRYLSFTFILGLFCLLLSPAFTQSTQASPPLQDDATPTVDDLPPRPTPELPPTSTPLPVNTNNDDDDDDDDDGDDAAPVPPPAQPVFLPTSYVSAGYIKLTFTPALQNMWGVVQKRDDVGNWVDTNWAGYLDSFGEQVWTVPPTQLGLSGKYRWVVYFYPGGPQIATTYPFDLPKRSGQGIQVNWRVQVIPF